MGTWARIGLAWALAWAAAGCGLNMQVNYAKMRPKLVSHHYDEAARYVDSVKDSFYSKNNRLLYYMDKGMVLNLAQSYKASNRVIEQAKNAADELWTESVGAHAASWVTTDNSLPYQGEDFEKVMLHLVAALNYIGLGDYANARVEARQIAAKLELYNLKYGDAKSVYSDDAFARWLSGRMGETAGDTQSYNDAWIDYKKALHVYKRDYSRYGLSTPKQLVADAIGVLQRLGGDFDDERHALRQAYPDIEVPGMKEADNYGRLVFLHLNGEAPFKIDAFWEVWTGPDLLRIAYPRFIAKLPQIAFARIAVRGTSNLGYTERMEDLTAIAIQNLNDHMGRIKGKAIARAVAKFAVGKTAQVAGVTQRNQTGELVALGGVLWNWGNAIAEEADKRSWITLPAEIGVSELYANPGPTTVDVDFMTAGGQVVEHAAFDVDVKPGQTTFLSYRTFL
jgi:hypothetical protein